MPKTKMGFVNRTGHSDHKIFSNSVKKCICCLNFLNPVNLLPDVSNFNFRHLQDLSTTIISMSLVYCAKEQDTDLSI